MIRSKPPRYTRFVAASAITAVLAIPHSTVAAAPPLQVESSCTSGSDDVQLQIVVDRIRSSNGRIVIAIYGDRPDDFLVKGKRIAKVKIQAKKGGVKVCLKLPRPGTYAAAAYHDEDSDNHLTRNFVGIPVEGHAFSNNPSDVLGLPAYRSVAFQAMPGINTLVVHFEYP